MAEAHIVHHLAAGIAMPELPPDIWRPPVLDAICARALAINPAERYATAAELEVDLRGVLVGAADSHARMLGAWSRMSSRARAERDALIARALATEGRRRTSRLHWAKEIDALLPDGESLDLTVVDVSVDPEPAAAATAAGAAPLACPRRVAAMVSIVVALGLVVAEARRGRLPPRPPRCRKTPCPRRAPTSRRRRSPRRSRRPRRSETTVKRPAATPKRPSTTRRRCGRQKTSSPA